jgi:hypothetical protein
MSAGAVITILALACPAGIALWAGWPDLFMFLRKRRGKRDWPA